ncbi:MAG: hypothetical protein AAFS10_19770 [Myxococcota bacterium]
MRFTVILSLMLVILSSVLSGCSVHQASERGVLVDYGNTTVEVETNPEPQPEFTYRRATPDDVVSIMVSMACTFPKGPSDLERQAFVSVSLEAEQIDPDSFNTVFVTAVADVMFADYLEDGMAERCPKELEEILASARLAF